MYRWQGLPHPRQDLQHQTKLNEGQHPAHPPNPQPDHEFYHKYIVSWKAKQEERERKAKEATV